jgi:glucokinase
VLVLPVGTGISGAMFVEGRLVHNPYAGEIGHVRVAEHEPCVCGAIGCLEAISSAAAIARRYRRAVGATANDTTNDTGNGAAGVVAALRAGDEAAARVWQEAIDGLAAALAGYTSVLAPELIVLAGGLSGAGETLLDPLRTGLRERLTWQPVPRLTVAEFGEDAACVGAVLLARGLLPDAVRTHR